MKAKLKIKPLSINDNCPIKKADYFKEIERQLPSKVKLPKSRLRIDYEVHLSQQNADLGNIEKYLCDAICKAWNIQDSNFYQINLTRIDCEKGKEKIIFKIKGHKMKTLLPLTLCIIITYTLGIATGIYINEVLEVVRSMAQSNFN